MHINISRQFRYTEPNSVKLKKLPIRRPMFMVMTAVDKIMRSGGYWFEKFDIQFGTTSGGRFSTIGTGDFDNWSLDYKLSMSNPGNKYASVFEGDYDNWNLDYKVMFTPGGSMYTTMNTGDFDNWNLDYKAQFNDPQATYATGSSNFSWELPYKLSTAEIPSTYRADFTHSNSSFSADYVVALSSLSNLDIAYTTDLHFDMGYNLAVDGINPINLATASTTLASDIVVTSTFNTVDILGDNSISCFMKFDDSLTDETGNYTPTLSSNITYEIGKFGKRGVYSGNSYTQVSYTTPTKYSASLTFRATGSLSNYQCIAQIGDVSVVLYGTNLFVGKYTGNDLFLGSIEVNKEYTVTFTRDSSTDTNRAWLNGVEQSTKQPVAFVTENNYIVTGFSKAYQSYFFTGTIEQLRVFNRQITAYEAITIFNESVSSGGKSANVNLEYMIDVSGIDNMVLSSIGVNSEGFVSQQLAALTTGDILGDSSCVNFYPLDGSTKDYVGKLDLTDYSLRYETSTYNKRAVFDLTCFAGNVSYSTPNEYSVTLRFKVDTLTTSTRCIVDIGKTGLIIRNGDIFLTSPTNAYAGNLMYSGIVANSEYFISFSHNTSTDVRRLWVNGGEVTTTGNPSYWGPTNKIAFGKSTLYYNGDYYTGTLDQVRIFNKLITTGDVNQIMNEITYTHPSVSMNLGGLTISFGTLPV